MILQKIILTKKILKNWKKRFCQKKLRKIKENDFAKKIFSQILTKMKNDFATKIFWEMWWCVNCKEIGLAKGTFSLMCMPCKI